MAVQKSLREGLDISRKETTKENGKYEPFGSQRSKDIDPKVLQGLVANILGLQPQPT